MFNVNLFIYWYTNIKSYSALKFILDSPDINVDYVGAVLNELVAGDISVSLISNDPGKDYDIYRKIILDTPQPIPELKTYPPAIQKIYAVHPCWIGWAGIFDRPLSKQERKILTHYRATFLYLLINGHENEAYAVMHLAEYPFNYNPDPLTGNVLYSRNVLREAILKI
jgi:hypothetical protein